MTAINVVRGGCILGSMASEEEAVRKPNAPAHDIGTRSDQKSSGEERSTGQTEYPGRDSDPASPVRFINEGTTLVYNTDYVAITDVAKTGPVAVSSNGGLALYGVSRRRL